MRRRTSRGYLKILAVVIIAAAIAGFFLLRAGIGKNAGPLPAGRQTGYKADDRQKLEQLIHQGAKND